MHLLLRRDASRVASKTDPVANHDRFPIKTETKQVALSNGAPCTVLAATFII